MTTTPTPGAPVHTETTPPKPISAADMTIATRGCLAVLEGAGVHFDVLDTDPARTVLAFDHDQLEKLARSIGNAQAKDVGRMRGFR